MKQPQGKYGVRLSSRPFWANLQKKIPKVKLKIPEKAFLKSESRISVTFKLQFWTLAIYQWQRLGLSKYATMKKCEKYKRCLNPYLQILENSSRIFSEIFIFWVVTQAVLLENSSRQFFEISILGRHTGRFTGKLIHSNYD